MRKAGGIIALIAGIFGTIAAILTLLIGGIGKAAQAHDAEIVLWLGFGGLLFSFLTIVLGAVTINARGQLPGLLLVFSAIAGAILGGTFVAVFMVLALVGGILAIIGGRPTAAAACLLIMFSYGFLAPSPATAQSMPNFDTIAYCKRLSSGSYSLEKTCRDSEDASKDWVRRTNTYPEIWRYCVKLMGTMESYSLLKTCINSEEAAKKSLGR